MEKRMFQQQSVLFLIIQMIVYLLSVGTFIDSPYCQILENSSRNFSEISAFRVMSQTVLIRSGKLIQNRAFRQKIIIYEFRSVTETVFMEISSNLF